MKRNRILRLVLALALCLGLTAGLMTLLRLAGPAEAQRGATLFVSAAGQGALCTQAEPCPMATGLALAVDGDTLIAAGGHYTGTGPAVITVTQGITLAGGWDGAPAGPVMRDPAAYPTRLDGERVRRSVFVTGAITVSLEGLYVTGGNATGLGQGPYGQDAGGGIFGVNAGLTVVNSVISDNLGSSSSSVYGRGGGIFVMYSPWAVISGNLVVSNTASTGRPGYGGGISIHQSQVLIQGNQVLSNTASTVNYGSGGGVLVDGGSCIVQGNQVRGNVGGLVSGSGGGLAFETTGGRAEGNLVQGNRVAGSLANGGGFRVHLSGMTLEANLVLSNSALYAGGIRITAGERVTLTNNVIAGNEGSYAGGIQVRGHPSGDLVALILVNNTIADNAWEGLYLESAVAATLTNNILAGHSTGISASLGTTATADHTLFYGNDLDLGGAGSISSTHPITGQEPRFVDPAGWDYHLQSNSPAVDAGVTVDWLAWDIDGDPRPLPAGGLFDIGADELVRWQVYLPLAVKQEG